MKKHNLKQQTEEWFELRRQHPLTASKATAIKTAGAGLETLCWTTIAEQMSSNEVEHYSGKDTERGNELEPQARALYELESGDTVEEVGFITNSKISPVAGVSPDGLIGDNGMIEIKCPADVKYLKLLAEYKTTGKITVESGYMAQMQMQMMIAERDYNIYTVYNPNFSPSMITQRIEPDEKMYEKIKEGLKVGEKLLEDIKSKLK